MRIARSIPAAARGFLVAELRAALPVFVAVLALLGAPAPAPAAEQVTVTVLHTTDVHGQLTAEDQVTGATEPRGLARLATLVAAARAQDAQALLLDAGDATQGAAAVMAYQAQPADRPHPVVAAMNLLRYDAMAVGNHEYDYGWTALESARRAAAFPWLSANTRRGGQPAFEPYRVLTAHGVRVGVLGLTTPAAPILVEPAKRPGLEFPDAVATAREWVPVLRGKERCDVVVVVAHMGCERDPATGRPTAGQEPGENRALELAAAVPGIDVMILGHTHEARDSVTVGSVLITQAGRRAAALGVVELRLAREGAGAPWRVESKRGALRPVTAETPADPALEALAAPYLEAARAWLDQPVGRAAGAFAAPRGGLADSPLLDLVHAAQRKYGKADVSLASLAGAGARLPAGEVRMRDLVPLYAYENSVVTLELTGAQLRAVLEHAARYFEPYDFGRTPGPLTDPDVAAYNFDSADGVEYVLDLTAPPGERVRDLRYMSRPLDDARKLKVAVNAYHAGGGGGYAMLTGAREVARTKEGLRDLLARYLREAGTARPRADRNWRLAPAFVAHPAREVCERLTRLGVWTEAEAKALDPDAPLARGRYAAWLGRAYDPGAPAAKPRFPDVPPEWADAVGRAERAGVFAESRGDLLRALEPVDLYTAVDWTVHGEAGGALPRTLPAGLEPPPGAAPAGPARQPVPSELRPARAPAAYGRDRLPAPVAQYAADRDYLDGWDAAADPAALTAADGARLLAAARYPLVSVLWTTDFHGAFQLRERDRDSGRPLGSSAVLAAYVARERAANPRGTLLLDGGDCFQGTMISNLSYGRPVIAQMNRLAYDASAVGNHEFDWSVDTLVARVREARFPFLSANLFEKRGGKLPAWVKPYEVFERHGVKVAVVGFSTVETPTTTLPRNVAALEFREEAAIARDWLARLRAEGAAAVVLMGHLPGSQDSAGTRFRGELAELGRAVEGEDALLGGHSHNFVNGKLDGVPILIAGSHARAVGRVDLVVDRRAQRVVESAPRLTLTYADAIAPDPAMAAFVDSIAEEIRPLAERVLCAAPRPLTRNRRAESTIGNWVADAMRARAGADVALQNPGGLRADIDAGPVTVQDVFELMPFDNRIAVVRLSGAQLLDAVEHSLGGSSCPGISGVRVEYDPARPSRERVVKLTLADGRPVDPGATYLVATNDFMAQGGDGYKVFGEGKDLRVTDDLVRDALVADCEARGQRGEQLDYRIDGRITAVGGRPAGAPAPVPVPQRR